MDEITVERATDGVHATTLRHRGHAYYLSRDRVAVWQLSWVDLSGDAFKDWTGVVSIRLSGIRDYDQAIEAAKLYILFGGPDARS